MTNHVRPWRHFSSLDSDQRRQRLTEIFEFLDDLDTAKAWALGEELMRHVQSCRRNLLQVVFAEKAAG